MDEIDKLLIQARQWIHYQCKEIGEMDHSTAALIYRIDKHLLDKHGPTDMINLFGRTVGYHDNVETKKIRQEWRREAATSICQIINDNAIEQEDD